MILIIKYLFDNNYHFDERMSNFFSSSFILDAATIDCLQVLLLLNVSLLIRQWHSVCHETMMVKIEQPTDIISEYACFLILLV